MRAYVRTYICMYTRTYVCTHVRTYVRTRTPHSHRHNITVFKEPSLISMIRITLVCKQLVRWQKISSQIKNLWTKWSYHAIFFRDDHTFLQQFHIGWYCLSETFEYEDMYHYFIHIKKTYQVQLESFNVGS